MYIFLCVCPKKCCPIFFRGGKSFRELATCRFPMLFSCFSNVRLHEYFVGKMERYLSSG